jgi:Na+/melibiose symporter-like transporter
MSIGKIIAYIAAAILIFFGVLFIWGAFSSNPQPGWILVGLISVAIGFGLIWLASRSKATSATDGQEVTYKLDLSGDVNLESLKCKSCGGTLSAENVKMVAGAPWVTCPYCAATYQLTEEPKW